MRRHQALAPLSHDHHHGLAQARRLRRAADEADPERLLQVASDFVDFFAREGGWVISATRRNFSFPYSLTAATPLPPCWRKSQSSMRSFVRLWGRFGVRSRLGKSRRKL